MKPSRKIRLTLWVVLLSLMAFALGHGGTLAAQAYDLETAIQKAISEYRARPGIPFYYQEAGRIIRSNVGGVVYLLPTNQTNDEIIPGVVDLMLVLKENNIWFTWLPGQLGYGETLDKLPRDIVEQIDPSPYRLTADASLVSAKDLSDYQLPWKDGEWATITRSYNEHGVGQIDFDLTGSEVTAAKDGTIVYINDTHNTNTYGTGAWWYWNVVIIEHGDHQYSLVGHLAQNSVPQSIKGQCSNDYSKANCAVPVKAGEVIGKESSTGYALRRHLHFETGQAYGIVAYPDTGDEDRDGNRNELIYAGLIYAEQNTAFQGYTPGDVAGWAYGRLEQASHGEIAPTDTNLVRNGDFSNGKAEWQPSGQIRWSLEGGALGFMRLTARGTQDWASFYQDLNYAAPANTPFEIMFELGNSGATIKELMVSLVNSAGRAYGAVSCEFNVRPSSPLQPYIMRGKIPATWANVRLEVNANPPDNAAWALIDNITVQHRPEIELTAVECLGPGQS